MDGVLRTSLRAFLLLTAVVAVAKVLGAAVQAFRGADSLVYALCGVLAIPGALWIGTWFLRSRPALRRRLRAVAVVAGTTSCGAGLVAATWPMLVAIVTGASVVDVGPTPAWASDVAAVAMCGAAGLVGVLIAAELLDDGASEAAQ